MQRALTPAAAECAGLRVSQIVNEPTAAAVESLRFGDFPKRKKILVWDWGGGTFDVSLLETAPPCEIIIKRTKGDSHLGGDDLDECLVDYVLDEFVTANSHLGATADNVEKDNAASMFAPRLAVREMKEALSETQEHIVRVQGFWRGQALAVEVTRETLNRDCGTALKRSMSIAQDVLSEEHLSPKEIDNVIVVGGSSHLPWIRSHLEQMFTAEKLCSIRDRGEIVSRGATFYAHTLTEDITRMFVKLHDVCPIAISVLVQPKPYLPKHCRVCIPASTAFPAKTKVPLRAPAEDTEALNIEVFEGNKRAPEDNKKIGKFTLSGLDKNSEGFFEKIQMDLMFNTDGILEVWGHYQSKDKRKDPVHK